MKKKSNFQFLRKKKVSFQVKKIYKFLNERERERGRREGKRERERENQTHIYYKSLSQPKLLLALSITIFNL